MHDQLNFEIEFDKDLKKLNGQKRSKSCFTAQSSKLDDLASNTNEFLER